MSDKPKTPEVYYGYYIQFTSTGNDAVDGILRAVATAGKSYHHTECWRDSDNGPSCESQIQEAAEAAAKNQLVIARQARESCAKAVCPDCARPEVANATYSEDSKSYVHEGTVGIKTQCLASAIHALTDDKLMGGK